MGSFIYIAVIVAAMALFTRWTREKQKKNGERQTPAWNRKSLTKEQQALVKEQYQAYRRKLYEGYPQVDRFERNKKRWIGFLILMRLFLLLVVTCMQGRTMGVSWVLLVIGMIWGALPSLLILLIAMAPKWQFACILYLLGAQQVLNFVNMLSEIGVQSWGDFSWVVTEGFKQNPLLVSLDVISWIYVLLILLTAVWLTLLPRSRKLAAKSDELNAQMKDFLPKI